MSYFWYKNEKGDFILSILTINIKRVLENIEIIQHDLNQKQIEWALIVKSIAGNTDILKCLLQNQIVRNLFAIGDSHLINLVKIKELEPTAKTLLIKPSSLYEIENTVKYADFSNQASLTLIEELNNKAEKLGKIHNIFLMIEMGDQREGINPKNAEVCIEKILKFKNINLIGLGSNFGCLNGPYPTQEDLVFLESLKQKIAKKFNLPELYLSPAGSASLPILSSFPKAKNLLRIGEAAFLGTCEEITFDHLNQGTFEFHANIIQKRNNDYLLDFGEVDVNCQYLELPDDGEWVGSSSDMAVYRSKISYSDKIKFGLSYKSFRHLMVSQFIKKEFQDV